MDAPKSISPQTPPPGIAEVQAPTSLVERVSTNFFRVFITLVARCFIWCQDTWKKFKDLPGTNYELGVKHLRNANLVDAVLRFRMVLRMQPENGLAWHQLGRAYLRQGKIGPGCEALRKALDMGVKVEETSFLLACADESFPLAQAPDYMPLTLVTEYFDFVAPVYNVMQREQFKYRGPALLHQVVFSQLEEDTKTLRILDLGAAAGQVAEKFRPHAIKIVGVDVSRGMAAEAQMARDSRDHLIFDEYHTMDLRRYLKDHPKERFNLILAEDVLGHLGDLQEVFREISDILAAQGLFAFSTEIPKEEHGYTLVRRLARFGHSPDYIRKLAQACAFKEVVFKEVELYPEHKSHQWVLQKI